jgi:phage replication-related protein YjqB (UPF0714/DUF867 family)
VNRRMTWVLSAVAVPLVLAAGYGLAEDRPESPQQVLAAAGTLGEYPSMTALRKVEKAGVAYDLAWVVTSSPLVVVAPHGGSIELRTSEITSGIAGAKVDGTPLDVPPTDGGPQHTQCQFMGRLPAGQNGRLHVTSEHWDVEECLILIGQRTHALSIHGTSKRDKVVYIGGLDTATGVELDTALSRAGFVVVRPAPGDVAGTSIDNFVNKDADGAGVQLELTTDLRMELFPAKDGPPSERGKAFLAAVRGVYA